MLDGKRVVRDGIKEGRVLGLGLAEAVQERGSSIWGQENDEGLRSAAKDMVRRR